MSYPYPQYYSNPTSPWDIEPPQQQQQQQQVHVAESPSHSMSSMSTPVFPQQLSPVVDSPASFDPPLILPPLPPPQQQQQQQMLKFQTPHTIHLDDPGRPSSQIRFDNIDESHFLPQQERTDDHAHRRRAAKAPARASVGADEMRSSTSPRSGGAGPSRVPHGRGRSQAHPYRRPSTATSPAGSAAGASGTLSRVEQAAGMMRSASAAPDSAGPQDRASESLAERSSARPGRDVPVASLALSTRSSVACPAFHVWRVNNTVNDEQRVPAAGSGGPGASTSRYADQSHLSAVSGESSCPQPPLFAFLPSASAVVEPAAIPGPKRHARLLITADAHFDQDNNLLTATFELPGMKRDDLQVSLNVCPYSRSRQIHIQASNRPAVPHSPTTVYERKYGNLWRSLNVPIETKASPWSMPSLDMR